MMKFLPILTTILQLGFNPILVFAFHYSQSCARPASASPRGGFLERPRSSDDSLSRGGETTYWILSDRARTRPITPSSLNLFWGGFFGDKDSNPPPSDTDDITSLWFKDTTAENEWGANGASAGMSGTTSSNLLASTMLGDLERAQRVGKATSNLVQDLRSFTVEGTAQDGRVRVVVDGQQRPVSVSIDENFIASFLQPPSQSSENRDESSGSNNSPSSELSDDREQAPSPSLLAQELSQALEAALVEAHAKSMERMQEKIKSVYNELGLSP